jgi:hypothetical protein
MLRLTAMEVVNDGIFTSRLSPVAHRSGCDGVDPLAIVSALNTTGVEPGLIGARLDPMLSREPDN